MKKQLLLLPIAALLLSGCGKESSAGFIDKGTKVEKDDYIGAMQLALTNFRATEEYYQSFSAEKLTKDFAVTNDYKGSYTEERINAVGGSKVYGGSYDEQHYVEFDGDNSKMAKKTEHSDHITTEPNYYSRTINDHDDIYYVDSESNNKRYNLLDNTTYDSGVTAQLIFYNNSLFGSLLAYLDSDLALGEVDTFAYGTSIDTKFYVNHTETRKTFTIEYTYDPMEYFAGTYTSITADRFMSTTQLTFEGNKVEMIEEFIVENVVGYNLTDGYKAVVNERDVQHAELKPVLIDIKLPTVA